jgi:hypothetical protein
MTLKNAKERLKDALKRFRTGINLWMLRDAGPLDRRWDDVRKNGDGKETGRSRSRDINVSITLISPL